MGEFRDLFEARITESFHVSGRGDFYVLEEAFRGTVNCGMRVVPCTASGSLAPCTVQAVEFVDDRKADGTPEGRVAVRFGAPAGDSPPLTGALLEEVVWEGEAAGCSWVVRGNERPSEGTGEEILEAMQMDGSTRETEVWLLVAESRGTGLPERVALWWDPRTRVLGGTLRGWAKTAVGTLKRELVAASGRRVAAT
jgi:hypothetical protein